MPSVGHKYLCGSLLQGEKVPLRRYFVVFGGGYFVLCFFVAVLLCFVSDQDCILMAS